MCGYKYVNTVLSSLIAVETDTNKYNINGLVQSILDDLYKMK